MKLKIWINSGVSVILFALALLVWHVHEHNLQAAAYALEHPLAHGKAQSKPEEDEVDQLLESIKLENEEEEQRAP